MSLERLFRLTKREYFADFLITAPLTIALLILSVMAGFGWAWLAQFAAGAIAWTFYEYAIHRWVSHRLLFIRDYHALHHAQQIDYIAVHPAVTAALYAASWLTFGAQSSAVMAGFSVGYLIYSALHTSFHYARIRGVGWLFKLKRRHALHHTFDGFNFGVSTSFWDRLFGTEW